MVNDIKKKVIKTNWSKMCCSKRHFECSCVCAFCTGGHTGKLGNR